MKSKTSSRLAIIDNSIEPSIYKPVEHWGAFLKGDWVAYRAPLGQLPDRIEDFSHILLTGSESSVLDRDRWVDDEVEFVREAFRRNRSILGSCYGHQLLAFALAGRPHIRRCPQPEIGWIPVEIVRTNPLLGAKRRAWTFSVHYDEVVDLPRPFIVLASTSVCSVQAFGVPGRNVWGLQIHPEIGIPEARAYLRDLARVIPADRNLYETALASRPRDSGLIRRIVKSFLAFPLDKN